MTSSGTLVDQTTYERQVEQTHQSLQTIDDTSLVSLTSLNLDTVQTLKQEIARIFPASNLPAFLLQGLLQVQDRTIEPERVHADLTVLFRSSKQIGTYSILAVPALAIHGYQHLLMLAGKHVDSAFPDGSWQFYTAFGLREDAARHCVETTGFHNAVSNAAELSAATCWVYTAMRTLLAYDDLLAAEWHEQTLFQSLRHVLREHARATLPKRFAFWRKKPADNEQELASQVAALWADYHLEGLETEWHKQKPFVGPPDEPTGDYVRYRRACFERYIDTALHAVPPALRAALTEHQATLAAGEVPAFQNQLTLLMSLHSDTYRDRRVLLPIQRACVALVVQGHYYLLDACARDKTGHLLVYGSRQDADNRGVPLPLTGHEDGTLRDRYERTIQIDRSGKVWADADLLGRLRPPALPVVKQHVRAILQQARQQPAAPVDPEHLPVDMLLARTLRYHQQGLRSLLNPASQEAVERLRDAPIVLNWDTHNGSHSLGDIRRTRRGCGDHSLTIIRTSRSMVFDMSHMSFDGAWGAALSEMMTAQASALYAQVARTRPGGSAEVRALAFTGTRAFWHAAYDASVGGAVEVSAETSAIDLAAITRLRGRLQKIQLAPTVNDLLLLGRCIHAATYEPGSAAQRALQEIENLPDGAALREQIDATLAEQRTINPALMIPMDASRVDPRLRIYPATFRNPLPELVQHINHCAQLVARLRRNPDAAQHTLFEHERRTLYHELHTFGILLQTLRQVTMRGESFSLASLRLLAHLPEPLQHLVSMIPQKIDMLNEIVKGREVFSNIGRVRSDSSITRFFSSRDDGETKLLVWGIMTDAQGQLVVTLRDFRPHVAVLDAQQRRDLAHTLAQDYLDTYAATVNSAIQNIQRIFGYKQTTAQEKA